MSSIGVGSQTKYFGLRFLDKKLDEYLNNQQGGYFVELGANDGVSQSNTMFFEKYRGWKGILVEPVPHNFLKCVANRAEATKKFCYACVSFEYTEKFVELIYCNLMTTSLGVTSDLEDPVKHAHYGRKHLSADDGCVFRFGALAKPLNNILIEAGAPHQIDLLSLDVEGAELEVLRGIDHALFRFSFMCIELRNFDLANGYLESIGYKFAEKLTHHDYLFIDAAGHP